MNTTCKFALQIIFGAAGLMAPFLLAIAIGLFSQAQAVTRLEAQQAAGAKVADNQQKTIDDMRRDMTDGFNSLRIENRQNNDRLLDKIDSLKAQTAKP